MASALTHLGPRFGVPLAALLLLAACSATPGGTPAGSGPTGASPVPAGSASTADVEAATSVLQAAKLDDKASLATLEAVRFAAAGPAAAQRLLAGGATGDALWAATWVYASSGTDAAVLAPLLANTDPTIRALAAAALVGLGDDRGFEPLIALLGESGTLAGSVPPAELWEFAADVLERYTKTGLGPTLAATEADRQAAQGAWRGWLTTNGARLQFDAATRLWSVR